MRRVQGGAADRTDPSEAVLIRKASLGDRAAFAELFHEHSPSAFRYALHMLDGDVDTAQDVTQEAWVKVWRNLPGFRGESQLRTWIFQIVAREVFNNRRRRRPVVWDSEIIAARVETTEPVRSAESHVGELSLWDALTLALAELPWRQRGSWLLRELDGLSYNEIAVVLDTTPTVVRGQLHRARRSLAIRMEQWR